MEKPMRYFTITFLMVLVTLLGPTVVLAKVEKPSHFPFPKEMVNAIRCDVCGVLVRKAYKDVQALFAAKTKTDVPVNEEDVLMALEDVCNPFAEAGQWIRRFAINSTGDVAPFPFVLKELKLHTKCKRTCGTVVEACEAVIDHESMDQLSPRLLRLNEYADGEALARALCDVSSMCTKREQLGAVRHQELIAMIKDDDVEEIEPKEMEIERMMDQVERKERRRQHVFSRKEITSMQDSILKGDREAVAQVDPSIMKLTDEEFASLQSMMLKEKLKSSGATSFQENQENNVNEEYQGLVNNHNDEENDETDYDDF